MTKTFGRRVALAAGAFLCGVVWCARPADAAGTFRPRIGSQTQTSNGKTFALLTVNDQPAASLRASADGLTPDARVTVIADRLREQVANGLMPGEVGVQKVPGTGWAVMARKTLLLAVTADEAAAHRMTAEALAREWSDALRRLLALPALTVATSGLTVPMGETRTVTVGGAALATDVTAQDTADQVTQSKFDPTRRVLTIRGVAPGRSEVQLQADGATASFPVVVMKYAARVLPDVTVSVTGEPSAPPDVVSQGLYAGLARAVNAEPEAQLKLSATPTVDKPIPSDSFATFKVPMRVSGANLLPVEATTTITVVNRPVLARPATVLQYSNNPEQVKHGQSLFLGRVQPYKPVRLDYHHQNMSGGTLVFHADLINSGDGVATVQVISGISLPAQDTTQVGRRAGASFLNALNGNVGLVLQVPPHARIPFVTQRMPAGMTVSGIVQLNQILGTPDTVSVQVAADDDQGRLSSPVGRVILAALQGSRAASALPDEPTDFGHGTPMPPASPYAFSTPLIQLKSAYAVGGKWAYVRIGHKEALRDETGKFTLWGNYGADYEISLTLSNPTQAARPVGIFFAPEAGLAAGVFRVDEGPLLEFDPIMPPNEKQVARFTLAPGETRSVHVQTVPLNGSFYPASLVVHAL